MASLFTVSLLTPIAVSFVAIFVSKRPRLWSGVRYVLSSLLHNLLLRLYPIKDAETNSRNLPAAPFWEPGGNGDEAKFLNGPQNSLRWCKLYGPIYRIWSGTNTEVVATHAEHIKVLFHDSDRHLKAKNNDSGWLMSEVLGQCVGLLSGAEWTSLRIHAEVPFSRKSVLEFFPTIYQQTQQFLSELFERRSAEEFALGDVGEGAVTIHATEDVKMLPFNLIATLLYGEASSTGLLEQLYNILPSRELLFRHVIAGGVSRFWWSSFLPTKTNRLLRQFQRDWFAFNELAYEKARDSGRSVPIVTLWDKAKSGEVDQTQLLQSLDEVLFANLDVTTGAISWLLANMASNQEAQSRLHVELLSALGEEGMSDSGAFAEYVNASGTFLAACVAESSRVRPVSAFSVPQAPPTDRVVGGYRIPRGTSVIVDAYALNIRNSFWGTDSASFRPDRWETLKARETRYQLWRFGFGPRVCMGRHIAEKMLRVVLVLLVRDYELCLKSQRQGRSFDTDPVSWITHPDVSIECRRRRKKAV